MVTALYYLLAVVVVNIAAPSGTLDLRFEVEGEKPIYPGQRVTFSYKIYYRDSVTLTEEDLPLLEADGFRKIGGIYVKEEKEGEYNVQILSQEVEAVEPGTFSFGPSILVGESSAGPVRSEIPPQSITVLPFPSTHQPLSFTGAIGNFTIDTNLLSPSTMGVGDTINLEIILSGTGNWPTVRLPDITCQPGFSGFFSLTDIPPAAVQGENKRTFTIELRPMTYAIHAIPSVEFSFFNPTGKEYLKTVSEPILIHVIPESEPIPYKKREEMPPQERIDWEVALVDTKIPTLPPLRGEGGKPEKPYPLWAYLLLLPIVCIVYFFQVRLREESGMIKGKKRSVRELLQLAEKEPEGSDAFYERYREALSAFEDQDAVEDLYSQLEAVRFGKGSPLSKEEWLAKARRILS